MKRIVWCVTLFALMMLAGCGSAADTGSQSVPQETEQENSGEEISMKMFIGDTEVAVVWEDNDAVETLREMTAQGGVAIAMERYGGWEQVGPIGRALPRQDTQTTTQPGDIMLYSGDQMVVFYGTNSWSYTRLGHITDRSGEELKDLLGQEDVTVRLER